MKVYDLCLAGLEEYFAHRLQEFCAQLNMSFFVIEPMWAGEFLDKLMADELQAKVLIDLYSDAYEPEDFWYYLVKEAKARGTYVINDPDTVPQSAHKGRFHKVLVEGGVPVPPTIIVSRQDLASFRLTDEMRAFLGDPFVVKPGWGGGFRGVFVDAHSEADVHNSANWVTTSDSFLLQRKLTPKTLDGHKAWFRVFNVIGNVIPCWWETPSNVYRLVTPLERQIYGLDPLMDISRKIAGLAKLDFFSTEITLTCEGQFVAVDYANDQCDTHPKSFYYTGVPDAALKHIAWLLVQKTVAVTGKTPFDEEMAGRDWDWNNRRQSGHLVPGE
jgi:hypothetical protein